MEDLKSWPSFEEYPRHTPVMGNWTPCDFPEKPWDLGTYVDGRCTPCMISAQAALRTDAEIARRDKLEELVEKAREHGVI